MWDVDRLSRHVPDDWRDVPFAISSGKGELTELASVDLVETASGRRLIVLRRDEIKGLKELTTDQAEA